MANLILSDTLSKLVYPAIFSAFNAYYLRGQICDAKKELKADIAELKGDLWEVTRDLKGDMRDIKGDVRRLEDRQFNLEHHQSSAVLQ